MKIRGLLMADGLLQQRETTHVQSASILRSQRTRL